MARRGYEGLSLGSTSPEKPKSLQEVGAKRLGVIKGFGGSVKERMSGMFRKTAEFGRSVVDGAKHYGKTAVEYGLATPEAVGRGLSKSVDMLDEGIDAGAAKLEAGTEAVKGGARAGVEATKAGAKAVGRGAVEAGKFGAGLAVAGAEAGTAGVKFAARKGKESYQFVSEKTKDLYQAGAEKVNEAAEWGVGQKNAAVERYQQTMNSIKDRWESWKQSREQHKREEELASLTAERQGLVSRLQAIEARLDRLGGTEAAAA